MSRPQFHPRDYVPSATHHFTLRMGSRNIKVRTDYPLTKQNSAAYSAELTAFIKRIESQPVPRDPFNYYKKGA